MDHLNPLPESEERLPIRARDVLAAEENLTRGRPDQTDERFRDRALAATTLPDEAEDFAFLDGEAHSIDRVDYRLPAAEQALHEPLENREVHAKVAHVQEGLAHGTYLVQVARHRPTVLPDRPSLGIHGLTHIHPFFAARIEGSSTAFPCPDR